MKPILFYDGGCPLCRREVAHYRFLDRRDRVRWIDVSRESDLLAAYGVDREDAMRNIHAVDEGGRIVSGVSAFLTVWRQLPVYRYLARFVERAGMVAFLDRLYARFAAWRYRRRCGSATCAARP